MDHDEALDQLYGVSPEDFVLVRSRLERELRNAGDAEGAAEIKRRRRPHLAAWAVNQIARQDPDAIVDLFDVTNAVAAAQRAALGGADSADDLREATRQRQAMLDELTSRALRLLASHAPKPAQYGDNITATFDAATLNADAAVALRAGRLTQPLLPPVGFGPLDPVALPDGAKQRARRPSSRERAQAERVVEKAKRASELAAKAADDADAEVTSADLAAQSALSHLEEVDRARERAQDALAEANSRLTDAQERATAARRAARVAAEGVDEAEARRSALEET